MPKKLLLPDDLHAFLLKRYENQQTIWLAGGGSWPLTVSLGVPTEREVVQALEAVRAWAGAWSAWKGAGTLVWTQRDFARLGPQRLPATLVLETAAEVAAWVSQGRRWATAVERYQQFVQRWPVLAETRALAGRFSALADYATTDFQRLFQLVEWLDANPASGLYLRQLPVPGLDTKWFEQRQGVVTPLLRALRPSLEMQDFHALCGLRRPAHRLRLRLLSPELRAAVGGVEDLEAPLAEIARLPVRPQRVVVVENLDTGLALPDMPGTLALMRLGNAVSVLADIPWLQSAQALYWGDLDTHGFAILERARQAVPHLRSILMDAPTLLTHAAMWGQEPVQCPDLELALLTPQEREAYLGLRSGVWGDRLRLEQERIPLVEAVQLLRL